MKKRCKSTTTFYVDGGNGQTETKAVLRCGREPHPDDDQHIVGVGDSKPQASVIWKD